MKSISAEITDLESKIYLIRGEKVMLDHDLADLYQVTKKRLREQVRRNLKRLPEDFMFLLSKQEVAGLTPQNEASIAMRGGRKVPPIAFTEHGVTMLSSILNSDRAIEVNIAVIRAFVNLRKILNSNREIEKKILELESKYDGQFRSVFAAIRELMSEHAVPRKRIIGLGKKDV